MIYGIIIIVLYEMSRVLFKQSFEINYTSIILLREGYALSKCFSLTLCDQLI